MTTQDVNTAAVEAFAGTMVGVFNHGALALMLSIGHQTGLFDAMAGLPPATSEEIAAAAGLHERYVREWLGAMVSGGIVDVDPEGRRYQLPAEHAACLTRAAGAGNIAGFMQFIPLLANVEQDILPCFRQGGGLPYAAYPRFHAVMAEASAQLFDAGLLDSVLPAVPGLPDRLRQGIYVGDIGCGSGHAIHLLASAFPHSRFVGYDFSAAALAAARAEAQQRGLTNVTFVEQDVAELDVRAAYDLVTAFDAIHDQAQPARVLQNIRAALRPGGTFLLVDVAASSNVADNRAHPFGTYLYTASTLHCMAVSLGLAGAGLGAVWGEQQARTMLAAAGFTLQEVKQLPSDPFNTYYIATKDA
jgi:SAM-dependent methyltransferase